MFSTNDYPYIYFMFHHLCASVDRLKMSFLPSFLFGFFSCSTEQAIRAIKFRLVNTIPRVVVLALSVCKTLYYCVSFLSLLICTTWANFVTISLLSSLPFIFTFFGEILIDSYSTHVSPIAIVILL